MEFLSPDPGRIDGFFGNEIQDAYSANQTNYHVFGIPVSELLDPNPGAELPATLKRLVKKCYRESTITLTYDESTRFS